MPQNPKWKRSQNSHPRQQDQNRKTSVGVLQGPVCTENALGLWILDGLTCRERLSPNGRTAGVNFKCYFIEFHISSFDRFKKVTGEKETIKDVLTEFEDGKFLG
jgi:hypothetical protein